MRKVPIMDIEMLQKQFDRIGARLVVSTASDWRRSAGIDIGNDNSGEFFDIRLPTVGNIEYEVVDTQPKLRHLLLMARRNDGKEKYLCGHDERHWFVCGVPDQRGIAGVISAMEALQPAEVRTLALRTVRPKNRLRRRNAAFVRQGEWFFVPETDMVVDERMIHHNEPISRGARSKPHMCQFLYRNGGEAVMVCSRHANGLTMEQYRRVLASNADAVNWNWRPMRRNAAVYVRGRISHPDHQTVVLDIWHRVLMNTEHLALASRNVVFLD